MESLEKMKSDLNKKFQKVLQTQAGFDFFVAIHDFIKYIELNPTLSKGILNLVKTDKELNLANKYEYLKKIYQGLEDISVKSNVDLGHTRYMVIQELNKIKNKDVSENNSFWKKRELSRKLAGIIYEKLNARLSKSMPIKNKANSAL